MCLMIIRTLCCHSHSVTYVTSTEVKEISWCGYIFVGIGMPTFIR